MRVEVKVNGAVQTLIDRTLQLDSRLGPYSSSAQFVVEGEERWSTDSLAVSKQHVALYGYTRPVGRQPVAINRGDTPFTNNAAAPRVIAMKGKSTYIDNFFGGYVSSVEYLLTGVRLHYLIHCQDYNQRTNSIIVNETYAAQTEQQILTDLFNTYWSEIDDTTYVDGSTSMTLQFTRISLHAALDKLASINSKEWYIDHDKKLHYFTPVTTEAPFELSDSPWGTTLMPYGSLKYRKEAGELMNRIYVVGRTDGGADINVTRTNAASYAKYGEYFDGKLVDRDINTQAWAELAGDAELARHADEKELASLICWQEGLVVGQKVKLNSGYRDIVDTWFLIQSIKLRMIGGLEPELQIGLGDYSPDMMAVWGDIKTLKHSEDI